MKRRQFCQMVTATALCVVSLPERATAVTVADEDLAVYQWSAPPPMGIDPNASYSAVIKTSLGEMTAELYAKDAPNTVNNFVFLAREGFYDWVTFHRIIKEFMVQTGDPTGTGTGSPGYRFADELTGPQTYTRGTLAMANAGPNTQGSQFFICHGPRAERLPKNYTIFGNVTSGLEVLDAIASVPVKAGRNGEMSSPVDPPIIESIAVVEASMLGRSHPRGSGSMGGYSVASAAILAGPQLDSSRERRATDEWATRLVRCERQLRVRSVSTNCDAMAPDRLATRVLSGR